MNSSAAASPEVYMSAEELADEIQYQRVLFLSLDDNVPDREEAEAAIKAEIWKLEKQLKALRQGQQGSMASNTGSMSQTYDDDPFGPPVSNSTPSEHFGPVVSHSTLNQRMGATSSTSSTPNSSASALGSNAFLNPSHSKLPTRKRSHAEHLDIDESENKYRRTSPSPHITRSTTPSTSSGQENLTAEDGFLDFTADEDSVAGEIAKVRQRHRDAEEKANRERDDAELARRLQEEFSGRSVSSSGLSQSQSAPSAPSAFDRLFGRPPSSGSQTSRLGHPVGSAVISNTPGFKLEPGIGSSFPGIKTERDHLAQVKMPGTFQESDSDSDIEIIPASDFNANGRYASFRGQNAMPSTLSSAGFINMYGGAPYAQSSLQPHNEFSATSEAAGHAALSHMQNQHYDAYMLEKQRQLFAGAGQPGFNDPYAGTKGYSLPVPPAMANRPPGFPFHSQQPGASGRNLYANSPSFGMLPGSAGPSGLRSILNQDPLSQILFQSSGYNVGSMVDIHGNPIDPRMSQLDNALNGRLAEISDYVHDPRRTAQEIQDLLENIRPDVEIPKEDREGTPDGLKYALYEHQKLALTWLKQMEEGTNKGGILADDMGLGKTISALALILSRPAQDRRRKTTLIVGPVALVRQWEREIQTKVNRSHRLSTFLYHSGKKASWETLRSFDIVLTTYGTLGAEYKRQEEWRRKCDENPNLDRTIAKNKFVFLGDDSLWYRVILDEAQCIKNKNTKAALAACHLKALTRFCLTGTPMMNGVHELFSLIRFLRIKPYNDHTKFTSDFGCLSKSGGSRGSVHPQMEANAMKKLQAVLKAMLLRRTKTSKIDGKPILTLPEKTEEIVHAIFNEDEQAYYTALETKTLIQFNKYVKAGTIGKNYSNILVLLLRLRQAACHPHLIMDFEEAPPEASAEDMETWAKTLLPEVIRRIMAATVPFECPVCYDPIPNPRIVIPCGHDTCSECLVKIAGNVQQEAIAEGNEAGDAKCPTCRGKVDMKKIIDYETFKKVHMGQREDLAADEDETQSEDDGDSIDDSSDTESSATESDDGSDEDIRNFVVPDDYVSPAEESEDEEEEADSKYKIKREAEDFGNPSFDNTDTGEIKVKDEVKDEDDDDDEFVDIKDIKPAMKPVKRPIEGPSHRGEKRSKKHMSKRHAKGKGKVKGKGKAKAKEKSKEPKVRHTSMAALKKEATRSKEGHRRYMRYLKKNWISSAKVDKCLEILRDTEPDIKTIVFSQFTTLLDLLEIPIRQEGWGFMRYDGSMSADARHHSVVKFTDDPRCKIMLVSLKAGNAGLNLVAASQVIILDPFWNPFIEMQAIDRAHRIGQQKPVKVHRILVEKTVEDRIIDLQNQKRRLVEAALDEKASQGLGRLGRQELIYLFNGGAERETAPRPAYVPGLGSVASAAAAAIAAAAGPAVATSTSSPSSSSN